MRIKKCMEEEKNGYKNEERGRRLLWTVTEHGPLNLIGPGLDWTVKIESGIGKVGPFWGSDLSYQYQYQ